jgi:hypothetical protein
MAVPFAEEGRIEHLTKDRSRPVEERLGALLFLERVTEGEPSQRSQLQLSPRQSGSAPAAPSGSRL